MTILQIMHGRISSIQANTRIQTKEMLIINYHQRASSLGPHSWRQIMIAENGVLVLYHAEELSSSLLYQMDCHMNQKMSLLHRAGL